ncbi:hypothetical protein ACLG6S_12150 [Thermodesulfobacteriota bacterium B35]
MRTREIRFLLLLLAAGILPAVPLHAAQVDLKSRTLVNRTAYIPPQCYAKTGKPDAKSGKPERGSASNPCYVCHTRGREPNYVKDQGLQLAYSFPTPALKNPWTNLFADRRQRLRAIADRDMAAYIRHDNYHDPDGTIILARRLAHLDPDWDFNGNGRWDGYIPDCSFHFDDQGFDRTPQGGYSGWRALAYFPFPGMFWPANGATDDVLIRLAEPFRSDDRGRFDVDVYRINLAIVEALIKRRDVVIAPVDEERFGVDLDRNGRLGRAERIVYDWAPLEGRDMSYVGKARRLQEEGSLHMAAGLFPEGTEFLHSVRYLEPDASGRPGLSARMKELRYMRKCTWRSYAELEEAALAEVKERDDFPDRIRQPVGDPEHGVYNGTGWLLQGFIEDRDGNLRPQSFEETVYCIGCHGGTGATTDATYAFARKLDSGHPRAGWYHWQAGEGEGLHEPRVQIRGAGVYYEYSYYLMYNRAGDDFHANTRLRQRFFTPAGVIRPDLLDRLHDDVMVLFRVSPEQAMLLNKAYRTIVLDQDYVHGRDVNVQPVAGMLREVEQDRPTGVSRPTVVDSFGHRFGGRLQDERPAETSATSGQGGDAAGLSARELFGRGLPGPDGHRYEVDWQGMIHRSRYSLDVAGVYFPFPRRLTLPTRMIIPAAGNPLCANCHRIGYPGAAGEDPGVQAIVPATTGTPLPADMTALTLDPARDLDGRWSPDGGRIVFVSNRREGDQLWLTTPSGGRPRQLTSGPSTAAWPQWSPDGSRIVFLSEDRAGGTCAIELVNVDGSGKNTGRRVLVRSSGMLARPVFHPDGHHIAYAARTGGNWDIWLVDAASGLRRRLTRDRRMETNPIWRPDGRALAFKVAPQGKYPLTQEYFMTFADGFEQPRIFRWDGPESVQMSDWSPDGRRIAYTAEIISDASGGDRVTYAAMVSDIVLEGERARAVNTRVLSRCRTLGDRGPVFSPDGRQVAFWGWDRSGHASLWRYDLEQDRLGRLTGGGFDIYPRWSPDGDSILLTTARKGGDDLALLRPAGQ